MHQEWEKVYNKPSFINICVRPGRLIGKQVKGLYGTRRCKKGVFSEKATGVFWEGKERMRIFKSEDLHKMEMHYACGDTGNRAEWFVCHAGKRVAADAVSRFYCITGDGSKP